MPRTMPAVLLSNLYNNRDFSSRPRTRHVRVLTPFNLTRFTFSGNMKNVIGLLSVMTTFIQRFQFRGYRSCYAVIISVDHANPLLNEER